jgi:hypothetical protein
VQAKIKAGLAQEAVQLICLLLLCYNVPEKDYIELIKLVDSQPKAISVFRKMSKPGKEMVRLVPTINE